MQDDQNNKIALAHTEEMLEAAADQLKQVSEATTRIMTESLDYSSVEKNRTRQELVRGYLLEEWTWLTSLEQLVADDEDIPAPDHCEHIDPTNPTVWIAMLAKPNTLYCMNCAVDAATEDIETGQELCDRCHQSNPDGEFFEFMMPIVNIQMMGSICRSCMDKV